MAWRGVNLTNNEGRSATAAIAEGVFVKSATYPTCTTAGSGEKTLGVSIEAAEAANDPVPVAKTGAIVRMLVLANSPNITIGDCLKAGTGGKGVKATVNGECIGAVGLEAATADDVWIWVEVLPPSSTFAATLE